MLKNATQAIRSGKINSMRGRTTGHDNVKMTLKLIVTEKVTFNHFRVILISF